MKFDWRNNRDFWAGVFFILTGAAAMIISRDYPMGSALRMGPGYFPTVLGGLVVAFGIYVLIKGVMNNEKVVGNWSIRAAWPLKTSRPATLMATDAPIWSRSAGRRTTSRFIGMKLSEHRRFDRNTHLHARQLPVSNA